MNNGELNFSHVQGSQMLQYLKRYMHLATMLVVIAPFDVPWDLNLLHALLGSARGVTGLLMLGGSGTMVSSTISSALALSGNYLFFIFIIPPVWHIF